MTTITDEALAQALVERLNEIIRDPSVRKDVERLLDATVVCSQATEDHPSIQVRKGQRLSFLGLLNGVVGTLKTGPFHGRGLITAIYDSHDNLAYFALTNNEAKQ